MAKSNMKIVQTGQVLQWVDRETGKEIFAANMAKVTDPAMIARITAYGYKQAIADGAAAMPTESGKRQKMQSRFDSIVNGTWGTRVASVAKMEHEVLFHVLVKLGHAVDTDAVRASFTKLPAASIGKLYARDDVQKMLATMESGETDEEFADLLEPADADETADAT